jgi:hypothetical protein
MFPPLVIADFQLPIADFVNPVFQDSDPPSCLLLPIADLVNRCQY